MEGELKTEIKYYPINLFNSCLYYNRDTPLKKLIDINDSFNRKIFFLR